MDSAHQVSLRVQLADARSRELRARASLRQIPPSTYADQIFRYVLQENLAGAAHPSAGGSDEAVYLELQVPYRTKQRLLQSSEEQCTNIAAFSGHVISAFLIRFDRDPRDLAMMHYLSLRLEERTHLSEADLAHGFRQLEQHTGVRLPPGYLAKWVFGRLKRTIQTFERHGQPILLTLDVIDEILSRTNPPTPHSS